MKTLTDKEKLFAKLYVKIFSNQAKQTQILLFNLVMQRLSSSKNMKSTYRLKPHVVENIEELKKISEYVIKSHQKNTWHD